MAFTLRTTNQSIDDYLNGTVDRCPLAQALYLHLKALGTPVLQVYNANPFDGRLIYSTPGYHFYVTYPVPAETQTVVRYTQQVDDLLSSYPRKHVFHYSTPRCYYPTAMTAL